MAVRARLLVCGIPLLLVVLTAVTFWPSLANDFVEWDDHVNVLKNPSFRGLGWTQLRWDFTNLLMGHYIPITWLSFSLDYTLWGMRPFGYHLTNVLLHIANVLLFYAVVARLLRGRSGVGPERARLGALVAAVFFAVHPLRAESVAWVTERRDVLSGFFFLVTILAYLAAVSAHSSRRRLLFAGSLAAYALALGSKSIVMTLPFLLVALDIYPLRRLVLGRRTWSDGRAVVLEKIPYLALGLTGAAVSYYAVHVNRFLTSFDQYPWPTRVAMGCYSLWFYVTTTLLPFGLSPVYELPRVLDPLAREFLVPTVVVLVVSIAALLMRARWPWLLGAWVAYAIILAPVTGVIHSGHQLAHDRYSYLSCLPWAVLIGAAAAHAAAFVASGRLRRSIAACAATALAGWIVVLAVMTWHQVQVWRDTQTLWTYAVDSEPACAVCHANLGSYLGNQNNTAPAIWHLQHAVNLRPERARTHLNLAVVLLKWDRVDEARRHLETALQLDPTHTDTLMMMGVALLREGRPSAALGPLGYALSLEPKHTLARTNFGTALARLGDDASAIKQYTRAISIDPDIAPPRFSLATLLARRGDVDGAMTQYEVVKRLDPFLADALRRQLQESW
ncbi:MAG: tetratricopeptide repeat protein [Candidatus Rokubacteria bacterium]|nr:tetratricopeptide repeat protein [Candidatus Rokubacteria bacterium]